MSGNPVFLDNPKALRLPAGVSVGGRSIGGRFVSPGALPGLIGDADGDSGERLLGLVYSELDRATKAHAIAEQQFDDDPKRYGIQRARAEQRRLEWESVAEQAESLFLEEEEEPFAVEWEIGFEYSAQRGQSSDVDVNVRVRRRDTAAMGQGEALRVLAEFRGRLMQGEASPIPPGYQMASINWRRPHQGSEWRPSSSGSSDTSHLDNFNNPMYADHPIDAVWRIDPRGAVRMGAVKP